MICAWCGGEAEDVEQCTGCGKAPLLRERYRLEARLGKRGSSSTYRAFDEEKQRRVVVKELLLRAVSDAKELQLFEREAKLLERIDHPGVPAFLDHFEWSRGKQLGLYIVQTFLDGESLEHELKHHRPSEREVARTMADVLDVLAALCALNVVHRDIKPDNLVRTENGIALVDFGAGRAVAESIYRAGSTVTGTFGYMAPEQMLAQAVPASDVYGLGATAVRLLTGKDPSELLTEHGRLDWRGDASGISSELAGTIDAMLAARPEDRPDDPITLAAQLREFADGNSSALASFRGVTSLTAVSTTEVQRPTLASGSMTVARFAGFSVAATGVMGALTLFFLQVALAGSIDFGLPFVTACLTFGLAFLMGIRLRRVLRHLGIMRRGVLVPAVVRRRFIDGRDFLIETEHRVDDQLHRTPHPVSETVFLQISEGDEVTVFCKQDEPNIAVLADADLPALFP